jgi:hypothetical protein
MSNGPCWKEGDTIKLLPSSSVSDGASCSSDIQNGKERGDDSDDSPMSLETALKGGRYSAFDFAFASNSTSIDIEHHTNHNPNHIRETETSSGVDPDFESEFDLESPTDTGLAQVVRIRRTQPVEITVERMGLKTQFKNFSQLFPRSTAADASDDMSSPGRFQFSFVAELQN